MTQTGLWKFNLSSFKHINATFIDFSPRFSLNDILPDELKNNLIFTNYLHLYVLHTV